MSAALFVVLQWIAIFAAVRGQDAPIDCFDAQSSRRVLCLRPFQSLVGLKSAARCAELCVVFPGRCLSFDYHETRQRCLLYEIRFNDDARPMEQHGGGGGNRDGRFVDLDSLQLTADVTRDDRLDFGVGSNFCRKKGPYLFSTAHYTHHSVTVDCLRRQRDPSTGGGQQKRVTERQRARLPAAGGGTPPVPADRRGSGPPIRPNGGCPNGKRPAFSRIDNVAIEESDEIVVSQKSLSACLDLCADRADIKCGSVEFNALLGSCVHSSERLYPGGGGAPTIALNTAYYEKLCLDDKAAATCGTNIIKRQVQMMLVGSAESVVTVRSLEECIGECLGARASGRYRCVSGLIFYNEARSNCILNVISAGERPQLFVTSEHDLVDYFELPADCKWRPDKAAALQVGRNVDEPSRQVAPVRSTGVTVKRPPPAAATLPPISPDCDPRWRCCAILDAGTKQKDCRHAWRLSKSKQRIACWPPADCDGAAPQRPPFGR